MQKVATSTTASKDSLYIAHESALSIFQTRAKSNGVLDWIHTREPHQFNNEIGNEVGRPVQPLQLFFSYSPLESLESL